MTMLPAFAIAVLLVFAATALAAPFDLVLPDGKKGRGEIRGGKLMLIGENGKPSPAPDGSYKLGDGSPLVVKNGVAKGPGGKSPGGPGGDSVVGEMRGKGGAKAIGPKHDDLKPNPAALTNGEGGGKGVGGPKGVPGGKGTGGGKGAGEGSAVGELRSKGGAKAIGPKHDDLTPTPDSQGGGGPGIGPAGGSGNPAALRDDDAGRGKGVGGGKGPMLNPGGVH